MADDHTIFEMNARKGHGKSGPDDYTSSRSLCDTVSSTASQVSQATAVLDNTAIARSDPGLPNIRLCI